eukprot:TRINITY_DN30982_c0_g1_i1.p1 TRINITY_DN30982_c0_g1~~TRINITY_DN30982_c0_g1_i1.p1  ORF type:complete len:368 (+),score=49.65 TRINITY_DN30982_c0_g1_i1:94-1104(+)
MLTISVSDALMMGGAGWLAGGCDVTQLPRACNIPPVLGGASLSCTYMPKQPGAHKVQQAPLQSSDWLSKALFEHQDVAAQGPAGFLEPRKLDFGNLAQTASLTALASPLRIPVPAMDSVDDVPSLILPASAPLPPPGLPVPDFVMEVVELPPGLSDASAKRGHTSHSADAMDGKAETVQPGQAPFGVSIYTTNEKGSAVTCVDWCIDTFREKMKGCRSRPLVSPPFSVREMPNLRLMVLPNSMVKGARPRDAKGKNKAASLHAAVKLKADCLSEGVVMTFAVTIGEVSMGPFSYDFSQHAVQGPDDDGTDWMEHIDHHSGSLRVGLQIFEVKRKGD